VDSQASSSLLLSAHVGYIQVNALFHILFASLHAHLGLLPGLAAHFCFLLRRGVRDMTHALSLLRWQLYACKTQHAFVLSQGHTANSVTSIILFGSLQVEFGSMVYISTSVHVKKFTVGHSTNKFPSLRENGRDVR